MLTPLSAADAAAIYAMMPPDAADDAMPRLFFSFAADIFRQMLMALI